MMKVLATALVLAAEAGVYDYPFRTPVPDTLTLELLDTGAYQLTYVNNSSLSSGGWASTVEADDGFVVHFDTDVTGGDDCILLTDWPAGYVPLPAPEICGPDDDQPRSILLAPAGY